MKSIDTESTSTADLTGSTFSGKAIFFGALALLAYQMIPSGSSAVTTSKTADIDMFEALDKVRAAAKIHRAKLVAANRMPAETAISKLVAEAYERYKREDELSGTGPRSTVTPTTSTYSRPASQTQPQAVPPVSRGTYRPPPVPNAQPKIPAPPSKPSPTTGNRPPSGQPGIGVMPKKAPNLTAPVSPLRSRLQVAGDIESGLVEVLRTVAQKHPQAIGVFLGVGSGRLAAETLRMWPGSPGLYLVDPFIRQLGAKDQRPDKERQLEFEGARDILKIYEGRHAFVRDLSFSFVNNMRDQKAQAAVVLIDKDDYEAAIYQDLVDWWPIVGRGGVLLGRLYAEQNKLAIDRFAKENNLTVRRSGEAWFFEKL